MPLRLLLLALSLVAAVGCQTSPAPDASTSPSDTTSGGASSSEARFRSYATVSLDADLSALTDTQVEVGTHLIRAAQSMDAIFWEQAYGNRDSLLQTLDRPQRRRFADINYGPWDRLDGHTPFVDGTGPKPAGANFYPDDVSPARLKRSARSNDDLDAPHTMVRRLPDGSLTALPYHQFFAEPLMTAAFQLRTAAERTESAAFRRALKQRADALTTGTYGSEWPAHSSALDIVIGPMNTGEDRLLGVKASAVALVLRRNTEAQPLLDRIDEQFPALWDDLPSPGAGPSTAPAPPSLQAHDVLYAAGAMNAGPKALSIPRPTTDAPPRKRPRLFPNLAQARVDSLLRPLAEVAIAAEQRSHVTTEAVVAQTAFQSLARTVLSPAPDSAALRPGIPNALGHTLAAAFADGDASDLAPMDAHTTILAALLHTLHRNPDDELGRAALLQFNFLRDNNAIVRDGDTYAVAPAAMRDALPDLAQTMMSDRRPPSDTAALGSMPSPLHATLDRLADRPAALAFEQGPSGLRTETTATAQ